MPWWRCPPSSRRIFFHWNTGHTSPPKIRPTCCPRPSEAKSYDGSWSRTVKIWTITNYKVTDILIWLMETLAVWLSEWVADLPGPELERRWLELQTISIPLDGGLETSAPPRRLGPSSEGIRHTREDKTEGRWRWWQAGLVQWTTGFK